MADTTITDAVVFPQDDGTGVADGNEDFNSAGYFSALSKYKGIGSYVGEDTSGNATLQFNQVDTTNEQVDVDPGYAYITEGSHTVQSGSQRSYDTTLPNDVPYVVVLPTEVTNLGLGTDTSNDLWLAVDPTANDSVYIRHGSGLSAPTDPNVKLGTVDTSTGATTRSNDRASVSVHNLNGVKIAKPGEVQEKIDEYASAGTRGTVVLEPDSVYDPANTIEVKKPVTVDGMNALIQPSTDQMQFDVHPHGALRNLTVDIAANFSSWSSTIIRCSADSGAGGSWAGRRPVLQNISLLGNQTSYPPGGTFIKFQSTSNGHLTFTYSSGIHVMTTEDDGLSGTNHAIGTGLHLEDNGSFLNSNVFDRVTLAGCDTGILQDGTGSTNNGNRFTNVLIQPEEGDTGTSGDESTVGWDIQLGANNLFEGLMWDNSNWQTASVRTGSGSGSYNVVRSEFADDIYSYDSKNNFNDVLYEGADWYAGEDTATNNTTTRAKPYDHHNCTANNSNTTVQLPENPAHGNKVFASAAVLTYDVRVETTDGTSILGGTYVDSNTDRYTVNTTDELVTFRFWDSFGWAPDVAN